MQPEVSAKRRGRRLCTTILCVAIIFLGTVWCGNSTAAPYNSAFTTSSSQCQGTNTTPLTGEAVLTLAIPEGPNITLCHLRASDGTLLRHFNLAIHGDIIGQGDGLLYINERGGTNGNSLALCAVQMDNGVTRWCQTQVKQANNTQHTSSISINNGTVYAQGVDMVAWTLTLFAINETSGDIIWSKQTSLDPKVSQPVMIAGQDQVYLVVYQAPPVSASGTATAGTQATNQNGGTRSLCAFAATTGQQSWCRTFPYENVESLAMDGNALYVRASDAWGSRNFFLYALDATSGTINWHQSFTGESGHIVLIIARGVLVTNLYDDADKVAEDKLVALRTNDGHLLWQRSLHSEFTAMNSAGSRIYLVTESARFQALNLADGTEAWSDTISDPSLYLTVKSSSILVGQTSVYVAVSTFQTDSMNLMAVQASNGKQLWNDPSCNATPTASTTSPATPGQADTGTAGRCHWQYNQRYSDMDVQLLQLSA